jgi:hypothetical protein
MAATKSSATFSNNNTTASSTSSAISTATLYAGCVYISIVQVGLATTAATITVQQSPDGSTFYPGTTFSAGLAAGTYDWQIALDPTCQSVEVTFTAQSGGTSGTLYAQLGEVTGV